MYNTFAKYLTTFLFIAHTLFVAGQQQFENILESSVLRVNELLDSSNVFLLKNYEPTPVISNVPGILDFSSELLSQNISELNDNYYRLKEKFFKSNTGINLIGNYNNNLKGGFAEDEDLYYTQRTYVGVEWNITNSGAIGNKKKIKALENQHKLSEIEIKENNLKRDYLFTRQFLTASFVYAQMPYLKQRHEVLLGLYSIYQELFYLKRVEWERLLKLKGEIKKVELLISRNQQILRNSGFEPSELYRVDALPVFGVNTDVFFTEKRFCSFDSMKFVVERDNLSNAYNDYINKVSVRPYVRYNFYDFFSSTARSYPSLGVSCNIPINKKAHVNDLVKIESEILTEEYSKEMDELHSEILNFCRLYDEKIQEFVYDTYQRDLLKERIRRELRKREIDIGGFNGVQALSFFDEFLDYEARITDRKKEIYLRLIDICYATKGEDPNKFLVPLVYDLSYKNFPGNRGAYLWSELFNVTHNDHLFSFMEDREISTILLSVGRSVNRDKLNDFLSQASVRKIETLGLIGNNDMIFHGKERIENYLNAFKEYSFSGFHLDIEPHVFKDWHSVRDEYLEKLWNTYRICHDWCKNNGYSLSVSVPYHYPVDFIEKIAPICDKIYVMNYEARDEKQLVDRMRRFSPELINDKIVVSVRPSDFLSIKELDYSLLHLSKGLDINSFCFSDLRGLNRATSTIEDEQPGSDPEYMPYRLESGEFNSPNEAEKYAKNVRTLGYKGNVSWKRNGTYSVVLGYFNNFDSALAAHNSFLNRNSSLPAPWIYMVH